MENKPRRKPTLETPDLSRKGDIKMDLREIGVNDADWIQLTPRGGFNVEHRMTLSGISAFHKPPSYDAFSC